MYVIKLDEENKYASINYLCILIFQGLKVPHEGCKYLSVLIDFLESWDKRGGNCVSGIFELMGTETMKKKKNEALSYVKIKTVKEKKVNSHLPLLFLCPSYYFVKGIV